jgi:hypothetical protein
MKFLCLAYGDGKDWEALPKDQQDAASAADEVLRRRGDMLAVVGNVTTVRAWDGEPSLSDGPFAGGDAPMVGFSLIDAEDLDEAIRLVAGTPCARARGAVEVWPIRE